MLSNKNRSLVYKSTFGLWLVATSLAFYRVSRQPFPSRQKWEQYETIFKATTLASVLMAIGIGGAFNRSSSRQG